MRLLPSSALLLATWLAGQEPPTAAAITEPGRTLLRPLEVFFAGKGAGGERTATERTLLLVVDPAADLQKAGFADALDQALAKSAATMAGARLGLGIVGIKGCVVLPPGRDFAKVAAEVRARLQTPAGEFQNVYDDVRAAAAALGGTPGEHEILLVTLENGDVEDDVEQTVQVLQRTRVHLTVLTSEACLADSYWAARPYQEKPRNTMLTGGDGPVIDLPWGWLFQITTANEVTPSGYAMFGLSRLAAATGGRVFLHSLPSQTSHQCGIYNSCPFCDNDHLPPDQVYREQLLRAFAPPTGARQEALGQLGKDPYFRATVQAWQKAAQAGLIRSQPAVKLTGTTASPDRQRDGRSLDLFDSTSFPRHQKQAEQAAQAAEDIGQALQAELQRLGTGQGTPRAEAAAAFTRVLLQLTKVNLLAFAGWCREVAPVQQARTPVLPPEVPMIDGEQAPVGIGYSNLSLCHGVKPFFELELPGGPPLRAELEKLDALFTAFQARYAYTQYGFALHRQGIARFHFTYPGIVGKVPRVRPKSDSNLAAPVTPARPPRAAPGAGGPASGPTTGGR